MMRRAVDYYRWVFLAASSLVIACMPWLWLAERFGWSQRPIHLVQTFLAVPTVWLASAGFLWFGRVEPGSRGLRVFAWFAWFIATLWLAFLAYVLFFVDFSWMDQR
jgi:hypothetical protein